MKTEVSIITTIKRGLKEIRKSANNSSSAARGREPSTLAIFRLTRDRRRSVKSKQIFFWFFIALELRSIGVKFVANAIRIVEALHLNNGKRRFKDQSFAFRS